MNKRIYTAFVTATLSIAALALAQEVHEPPHAPYLTDVAQAQAKATEKGQDLLMYFHSDT